MKMQIIKIVAYAALTLSMLACTPIKKVPVAERTVITERLVRIPVPADSATVRLLFECDSLNRVLLRGYDETKTDRVVTEFKQQGNAVTVKFRTRTDTVFIAVRDTNSSRDVVIPVAVEKKSKGRATWWIVGLLTAGCMVLGYKLFMKK